MQSATSEAFFKAGSELHSIRRGYHASLRQRTGGVQPAFFGGFVFPPPAASAEVLADGVGAGIVFRKAVGNFLFALPQQCDFGWCQTPRFGRGTELLIQ